MNRLRHCVAALGREIGSRPAFQAALDVPAGEVEEVAGRIRARWPAAAR
jgi:hypothetical protein